MLIASNNILQEEWVQLWLDRLTPKQQVLVIEVLKDGNKRRKPTAAAVVQAEDAIGFRSKAVYSTFVMTPSSSSELASSVS